MAVAAGIFVKIPLVILLGAIEVYKRAYLNSYGFVVPFLQPLGGFFNHRQVGLVGVINACPVLRAGISALPVYRRGVD